MQLGGDQLLVLLPHGISNILQAILHDRAMGWEMKRVGFKIRGPRAESTSRLVRSDTTTTDLCLGCCSSRCRSRAVMLGRGRENRVALTREWAASGPRRRLRRRHRRSGRNTNAAMNTFNAGVVDLLMGEMGGAGMFLSLRYHVPVHFLHETLFA